MATLSRRARDVIEQSFERTSDLGKGSFLVPSRLHDFGFRCGRRVGPEDVQKLTRGDLGLVVLQI